MALKRAGMTLIELIIYIALSAVAVIVAGSLFVLAKRSTESANANYFLNADAETAVAWVRRDLQQSCLATIQTYPLGQHGEAPGASFCSALLPDDVKRLDINEDGHPNWRNHVYYTLQKIDDKVGRLVRWSKPTAADSLTIPTLAPELPGAVVASTSRAVHTRVILANQELFGVGNPDGHIDDHGGFHIEFVRRSGADGKETLSDTNPAVTSAVKNSKEFLNDTKLVQVEMKFFTSMSTGKPSFYSLRFRVCPLY